MVKTYTVAEYADLINVSTKTVYKMIDRNELKTRKEPRNNKLVTVILTDPVQPEVITSNDPIEQNNLSHSKNGYNLPELVNFMTQIKDDLLLAGQAKLLMDSENKTKEEYFRVIQENTILKEKIKILESEIQELKKQSFWFKNRKL